MKKRTIKFVVPGDVVEGSEIEKLHILWAIIEQCELKQAIRMVEWALDKLHHLKEDRPQNMKEKE